MLNQVFFLQVRRIRAWLMILAHIHFQFKNISCEGICLFVYILGGGGGLKP